MVLRALGLALLGLLLCGAKAPDPLQTEFRRLAQAGGAVNLLRLADLAPWVPMAQTEAALRAATVRRGSAPLVRAVAWWLLRERARARLDVETAAEAQQALGLLTGWVVRSGAAPHSTVALEAQDGWRVLPEGGHGVAWLEASVRPNRATRATLATRVVAAGGPAVLRLGYDDQVVVWLNGDEVYRSAVAHRAWLDQAAVPVVLRAGSNHLRVEVAQTSGAWRLMARFTDAQGVPLVVQSTPDAWVLPEPAEGAAPEAFAHLWAELGAAAEAEGASAQAHRDYVDYARITGLPDPELAEPRVVVETAWALDPSPRSLRAWVRILPDAERASVRANQRAARPVVHADHVADLFLQLADGWRHYYARRHGETLRVVAALRAAAPGFLPTARLEAVLWEDLGLPHRGVAILAQVRGDAPGRARLDRAYLAMLQSAGRTSEALEALRARVAQGVATTDDRFQLADLLADRGATAEAVALLDGVYAQRPELVAFALEAAAVLRASGQREAAMARLAQLHARMPGDGIVAERLARLYASAGRSAEAVALVQMAVKARPEEPGLSRWLATLTQAKPLARLGPELAGLAQIKSPADAPAHVLYHHAHAEIGADGRAVRRIRRVVRILNEEGARRFGEWALSYVPSTQRLEIETARRVRAGASDRSPQRRDEDLSEPEYRLYYDLRAEVLTFDRPEPGDLIEVAWRQVDTEADPSFPDYFGELAYLQETVPRATSVVEVAGPGAVNLNVEVVADGLEVRRSGGRIEAHDVPVVAMEPSMPGASDMQAYVHVSTLQTWDELNTRYQRLLGERAQPTPALRSLAQVWAGDAQGTEAILGRLYERVADRTRYVGLEFGVRSFQPATPAQTLARGYGDCKDKATLLIALARSLGIEARLTLVRTRGSGAVRANPPSFAIFDHAIVYVPELDRFMDPTIDRNDPWTLPPSDQGGQAFVVGEGGTLRTIPRESASQGETAWAIEATLDAQGAAQGTLRWISRGQSATQARRRLEGDARASEVSRVLGALFPGAQVEAPSFSGLRPARDPVTVEGAVRLPAFSSVAGGWDIPQGGASWRLVARYAQAAVRETPLHLEFNRRQRLSLQLKLPLTVTAKALPEVALESPFGQLRASAAVVDGVVQIEADLRMEQAVIAPADYPAFRGWLGQVDDALARVVEVRP